ncbi:MULTISPECIES: transporter suffix domain-containing protein [unclassified Olleya]|uniref:transporter suffix domain-containing protein n=1 Tax=unclassified Olleya TaxID=2615019 RepID=UPI0011ABFD83|nr:transporter suffix domain-containing protein [Olleya sp. Hel_I_94]TVZ47427.1 hypothetical protein JM82_2034 [Olleya sp. Hel_I_94]
MNNNTNNTESKKNITRTTGYTLLTISFFSWICVFVVPFLELKNHKLIITSILIIIGEITFYASIALLGKQIIKKLKGFLKIFINKHQHRNEINNKSIGNEETQKH